MTQDGRWKLKYNEVMSFMEKEYRKLSKYYPIGYACKAILT